MIYFFNWIFKKESVKIHFLVPKIIDDCRTVNVEISKKAISRYNNQIQLSKEPVGMVDDESDNGSFVSKESYADKVSGGSSNSTVGLAEMI